MHTNLLIGLALFGFLVSVYILYVKRTKRRLICLVGDDCDRVVKSAYGYLFFGAPNELFGVLYYAAVIVAALLGVEGSFPFQALAACALLVSLYLAAVQMYVLKGWCEFCLSTAVVNGVLLALVLS